jgi:hypothetical protein
MGAGTGLLLSLLMTAAFLYVLYFVIRAAVESGVRRALTHSLLRPTVQELIEERRSPPTGGSSGT